MVLLKSCPRCKGDLAAERDVYGPYLECLQCGYMRELEPAARTRRQSRPSPSAS